MLIKISKRRMESLLRAEELAREYRFQITCHSRHRDENLLADYCLAWIAVGSKNRWIRPEKPVCRHSQTIRQQVEAMAIDHPPQARSR